MAGILTIIRIIYTYKEVQTWPAGLQHESVHTGTDLPKTDG